LPPSLFAVLYLLTIPLFAVLYLQRPHEFYHSTIQFEPHLEQDKASVTEILQGAVGRAYRHGRDSEWQSDEGWRFDPDQLFVHLQSVEGRVVEFDVIGVLLGHHVVRFLEMRFEVKFENSADETQLRSPEGELYCVSFLPDEPVEHYGLAAWQFLQWPDDLFPGVHNHASANVGHIWLTTSERESTLAYLDAVAGVPGPSGANFERMLYLSIVTITTLGYGDVVPLTAQARLLVGCESVAGIVLVGLYLNALAARTSHRLKRPPGADGPGPTA
jgi:hypothetical protein